MKDKRKYQINFRVNSDEHRRFLKAANTTGLRLGAWIRMELLRKLGEERREYAMSQDNAERKGL